MKKKGKQLQRVPRIEFEEKSLGQELEEFKKSIWRVSTDPIAWNNVTTLV